MIRFAQIAVLALALLFVLSSFYLVRHLSGVPDETTKVEAPLEATLALVDTTSAVLAGVALHKDFFREAGLEITARLHPFGKTAMADVLDGRADFATVAATPITMAIMNGEKISILATIQTSNKDNAIVALVDSDIGRPADLQGKKIAATFGTTSDFFIDAFLAMHGIGGESVKKINLRPELLQEALINGTVDAVSVFQPFLARMEKTLSVRYVTFYDKSIYSWTFNVVARQNFVRAHPEKVRRLLRALVEAEEFVRQQPAEAQKVVASYSGIEPELVAAIWPNMKFAVSLNQILVLTLEDQTRWAISSGSVAGKTVPNYLDYIYFDGLRAISPEAVKILR